MHKQTDFPLPSDLPRPVDDGAATHLVGMMLPKLIPSGSSKRLPKVPSGPAEAQSGADQGSGFLPNR
jgi:hypothetical protein